ncbi:hypothetical protein RHORCCE3_0625 [Rickettsia hoogstraalii str. RCCE3]|nr:hypothetical protein RHORCCE3_0625 [Rickettsia hoogstraalii str. RCCE3]
MDTKSSLREELRSNSTKQSSKKFCKSEFFIIFPGLPRRYAPRNDEKPSHTTIYYSSIVVYSPLSCITLAKFPCSFIENTLIGNLFSLATAIAAVSMTCRLLVITSL